MKVRAKDLEVKDRFNIFGTEFIVTRKDATGIHYVGKYKTCRAGIYHFGLQSQRFVNKNPG